MKKQYNIKLNNYQMSKWMINYLKIRHIRFYCISNLYTCTIILSEQKCSKSSVYVENSIDPRFPNFLW